MDIDGGGMGVSLNHRLNSEGAPPSNAPAAAAGGALQERKSLAGSGAEVLAGLPSAGCAPGLAALPAAVLERALAAAAGGQRTPVGEGLGSGSTADDPAPVRPRTPRHVLAAAAAAIGRLFAASPSRPAAALDAAPVLAPAPSAPQLKPVCPDEAEPDQGTDVAGGDGTASEKAGASGDEFRILGVGVRKCARPGSSRLANCTTAADGGGSGKPVPGKHCDPARSGAASAARTPRCGVRTSPRTAAATATVLGNPITDPGSNLTPGGTTRAPAAGASEAPVGAEAAAAPLDPNPKLALNPRPGAGRMRAPRPPSAARRSALLRELEQLYRQGKAGGLGSGFPGPLAPGSRRSSLGGVRGAPFRASRVSGGSVGSNGAAAQVGSKRPRSGEAGACSPSAAAVAGGAARGAAKRARSLPQCEAALQAAPEAASRLNGFCEQSTACVRASAQAGRLYPKIEAEGYENPMGSAAPGGGRTGVAGMRRVVGEASGRPLYVAQCSHGEARLDRIGRVASFLKAHARCRCAALVAPAARCCICCWKAHDPVACSLANLERGNADRASRVASLLRMRARAAAAEPSHMSSGKENVRYNMW